MVQTRFQAQFQGVKSFDLPMDKHDNTNSAALKSENFDDTLSCSEFASTASFYSEETPLREGSLETTIKVESLVEQLDDYECSTLDSLNARWPSIRARLKGMKPHLPKKADDKPTLVLDLDETLLHTYRDVNAGHSEPDYIIYASENTNQIITAGTLRPGVKKFLKWASEIFEVVVWTAGDDDYAATVMNILDADRQYISHVLGRSACIQTRVGSNGECMYVKDLCALGRDLSRTFMVDNAPHAATLNLSNLIPIEAYYGETTDHELEQLRQFLESKLTHRKDMRIILHRQFNLKRKLRQRINDWKHAGVSLTLQPR